MKILIVVALLTFLVNIVASASEDKSQPTPPTPPWDKTISI